MYKYLKLRAVFTFSLPESLPDAVPQEKAAWGACFFTTPVAHGAVCPAGGLTAWTAALFSYTSFLGESFMSGVSGDPRS